MTARSARKSGDAGQPPTGPGSEEEPEDLPEEEPEEEPEDDDLELPLNPDEEAPLIPDDERVIDMPS